MHKQTLDLSYTLNQIFLTDMSVTVHTTGPEHTLFSNTHNIFSRIDHMYSHKTSLSKFKTIKISCQVSFPNILVWNKINSQRKNGKFRNTCKLDNTLLNNHESKRNQKWNFKSILKQNFGRWCWWEYQAQMGLWLSLQGDKTTSG